MKLRTLLGIVVCIGFFASILTPTALADAANLAQLVTDLQSQMTELQSTVASQKAEIQALKTQGAKIQMSPGGVEGPVIDEGTFTKQFDKNLKRKIGKADKWLNGLKFGGDFRLRYEGRDDSRSTMRSRNRFRFRLRYGFEKKFSEEFKIGFRLVSGSTNNPTSTNQTMTSAFAYKPLQIDRAYAIYTPKWALAGPIKKVEIGAGKVKNPLAAIHSWLLWDSDVTPEGIYEKTTVRALEVEHLTTDIELLATQFIITEGNGTHADSEFYGFSGGLNNKITADNLKHPINFKTFANYEFTNDYQNVAENGIGAPYGQAIATGNNYFVAGNNTGNLGVLTFYHELGWKIDPLPKFKLFFEHGQNTDAHQGKAHYRHLWVTGAKIGKAKKKGTWELGYTYGWMEANSTFSAWADADFGNTDRRGSVVKAGYALTDYLTAKGAAFFTNAIDTSARGDSERRLFQLDLVWKF